MEEIYTCWMQDADISRYMWWQASEDIEETKQFIQYELEHLENEAWFRWILVEKSKKEIIGTCLLYYNDEESHWDISYNLGKKYWKKGYVIEAMKKVLDFAKKECKIQKITTSYAKVNVASAKVLHKLHFEDIQEIPYPCNGGKDLLAGMKCSLILQ